jgi:predicted  nucleic acid-binding Zn-ribbon protein
LKQQIEAVEAARDGSLSIIELQREELARIPQLSERLSSLQRRRDEHEDEMGTLRAQLTRLELHNVDLERQVLDMRRSRVVRLLRKLGLIR